MRDSRMQSPDSIQRQSQVCVPHQLALEVDASRRGRSPGLFNQCTLKKVHAEVIATTFRRRCYPPDNCDNIDASHREDAIMHEQDRDLDSSHNCAAYALEGHE